MRVATLFTAILGTLAVALTFLMGNPERSHSIVGASLSPSGTSAVLVAHNPLQGPLKPFMPHQVTFTPDVTATVISESTPVIITESPKPVEAPAPVDTPKPEVVDTPKPVVRPATTSGMVNNHGSTWDELAQCESSGNWADTAGQFEGGLQFLNSTWLAYGGGEFAQHAYDASREEQITIAERALAGRPDWSAWPACSRKLGLR